MHTKTSQLSLHQALAQLQALHIPVRLTPRSVALWSPNMRVSGALRTAIRRYSAEIRDLIARSHISVCVNPQLHKSDWFFEGDDWTTESAVCGICSRLSYLNEAKPSKSNYEKIHISSLVESSN